jgi:chromosome partitioning protein
MSNEKTLAKVVAVYNQKGGCGKTTTTVNLAAFAGINGIRTFVADIDEQESASSWMARATRETPFPADYESMSVAKDTFDLKIEKIAMSGLYDLIIIDCPPAINNKMAQAALMISDVVIVPAIPSPIDSDATDAGFELIELAKRFNKKLKVVRLNTKVKRTNLAKSIIDDIREQSLIKGYAMIESSVADRSCYGETVLYGKGVAQLTSSDVPVEAIREVEAFCNEILTHVFELEKEEV